MGESVPDGAGIGDVSETRRRKHSVGYAEEVQRSSRRRDQAKWYRFIHYRPLGRSISLPSVKGLASDSEITPDTGSTHPSISQASDGGSTT